MNESVLQALIKLFALISDIKTKSEISMQERNIVESFLLNHLNRNQVQQYLHKLDYYLEYYHSNNVEDKEAEANKITAHKNSITDICNQINAELHQKQKLFIIMQLIEFIAYGVEVTNKELNDLENIADCLNINEDNFQDIKNFIIKKVDSITINNSILTINNKTESKNEHHIHSEHLDGIIKILFIKNTHIYFLRYTGENDLLLNNNPIITGRTYIFNLGTSIHGQKINTIFYSDIDAKFLKTSISEKVLLSAHKAEYIYSNSNNGMHSFNFNAKSGKLTGIIGGSGVGKTTLLNILSGTLVPQEGKVLLNNYDVYKDKNELESIIGFITQDNLLIDELTVYQNLYYNARLCLGNISDEIIENKVEELLISLSLHEIKNLKVGNELHKFISGGQRKRLNIALELIREPSVLFVDEPTSGLSSTDAEMVMDLLKEQAIKGKLVIVNIHQPSSEVYKLFDKVYVVDKEGYIIYNGNPIDAIEYFRRSANYVNAQEGECGNCGNINAEQILNIINAKVIDEYGMITRHRKTSPQEWHTLFENNKTHKNLPEEKKIELPEKHYKISGVFRQFSIFFTRDILSKLTNRQYLLINAIQAPILALIIGYFTKHINCEPGSIGEYVFSKNDNFFVYLFMCIVVTLFMGLTLSANELINDRKILKRESFLKLSRLSYLSSKIIIVFAISAIQTLFLILVGNTILQVSDMTFSYWLVLFSTACFANMLGLNISAGLNSVVAIYILIPLMLVPQLLFGGVIVKFDKLHKNISSEVVVPFIGDLMASRWAYEALTVNQFTNNKYEKHFFNAEKEMSNAAFYYNFLIPELIQKLNNSLDNKTYEKNRTNVISDLNIIKNEIIRLKKKHPSVMCDFTEKLIIDKFTGGVVKESKTFLKIIKTYYINKHNDYNRTKDNMMQKLIAEYSGKEAIGKLYSDYYNEDLAELVQNKDEIYAFIEHKGRILQKSDPIFREPESKWGRAHLYSPVKIIFEKRFDTFWFNIAILWLMNTILFLTLYFNVLRRSIGYFNKKH